MKLSLHKLIENPLPLNGSHMLVPHQLGLMTCENQHTDQKIPTFNTHVRYNLLSVSLGFAQLKKRKKKWSITTIPHPTHTHTCINMHMSQVVEGAPMLCGLVSKPRHKTELVECELQHSNLPVW